MKFHLLHKWTKWEDMNVVTRQSISTGALLDVGIRQGRRCEVCGKLQLKMAWSKFRQ